MPTRLRQWSVYVSGVVLSLAVSLGIPLLLMERVASVFTGLPTTPVG